MEYKSPLSDDLYSQPKSSSYDQSGWKHSKRHDNRYSPYGFNSNGKGTARDSRSANDNPELNTLTEKQTPKYMDQYRLLSYPKELTNLICALECKLCGVEFSSPIVAKMHYSGKQHAKKIKRFLREWSMRTGSELPDISAPNISSTSTGLTGYCELCDVRFLTINDRVQHYAGKTHRKNESNPLNAKKKKKSCTASDISNNRFGIGATFSPAEEIKPENEFECKICNVTTVSQDQLQIHFLGKKHKLKVEEANSVSNLVEYFSISCKYRPSVNNERQECEVSPKDMKDNDLKNNWVCLICNGMKFESEAAYKEHQNSGRHLMRVNNRAGAHRILDNHFYCFHCMEQYCSMSEYTKHLFERQHKSTDLIPASGIFCGICNVNLGPETLEEHIKNKKHLKLELIENTNKLLAALANEDTNASYYFCSICNEAMDSFIKYSEHLFENEHIERYVLEQLQIISKK